MDFRNAGNDAETGNGTLINLEDAVRARISKLSERENTHVQLAMTAASLQFRVNHRHEADVLHQQISKLRKQLRGIRRGPPVYHDIFSIEPFTD